ncbi:MAG: type II secretion system protein M [Candidatus Thiodiazotropha sp. (ex Dulcina madagascariensis)]|nr:type II secretion system protein M [Candidatus Thiodiazotropha sp. (ex Epidulcina cf. delphinae)]MCU7921173.1 type II secretion system protein M [Candidatus Thiodiazotropha sp. (ex Dulcina madagascariensis)]MCU7925778.1 type II secretion system protein M [Candidatus Thiodiazotropha sp. (ex Dulcina madagascariensis)]
MNAPGWSKSRCDLVLFGLAAGLLLIGLACVGLWLDLMGGYREVADDFRHRTAHYLRIAQREASLQAALKSPSLNDFIKRHYLTGEAPGVAYAGLQQQIKEVIESAGGVALSTQLVQRQQEQEQTTEKIIVRVRMQGDSYALQKVVHALEARQPLLFFEQLMIQGPARVKPELQEKLDIRFDVYGYFWKEKV